MATLTVQSIAETGTTVTFAAVSASDTWANNGNSYLRVKNANGAICTVTVAATSACNQGYTHNKVVAVPATTGDMVMGPFPKLRFGTTPVITYSVTATVTIAVVTLT